MKPNYILKPAMKQLGVEQLRAHQLKPIQSLMQGNDTIVVAGTGSGKSLIYQLPALLYPDKLTLVIEPTLSLMYDQVNALQEHNIEADYIDSFRSKKEVSSILRKLRTGELTFLYVTPERLQSNGFRKEILQANIAMVVVDECHCVTEWGYSFREAYLKIGEFIDTLPKRPVVCACSATLPEDCQLQVAQLLGLDHPKVFKNDLSRKNLVLLKKDVTSKKKPLEKRLEERFKEVKKCIEKYHKEGSVVIYALTTGYVDALFNYLNDLYPNQVVRCHAQIKPDSARHRMELDFLQGKRKIMVATSAFGMGIDVPDVELVIHFNTPLSMVDYIQQIGRGGRDQQINAHCVLFYDQNGDDDKIVNSFRKKAGQHSPAAKQQLEENYSEVQEFLKSGECMTKYILRYQGQDKAKSCKCCTNCAKMRRGTQ